jgi:HD-GYP domain-containing protein (c-di-GMP phosphodiesterase class II)
MLPIALGTLIPADKLDFDLYMRSDEDEPVLFRGRKYPLEQEDIDRLIESSVATLYIKVAEHEAYCDFLRNVVLENAELPPDRRFQVLTEVNRSVFESAFSSTDSGKYIEFAERYGNELTDIICSDAVAIADLSSLMSHDYYTFTHVANVTTYCVSLAAELGHDEPDTLRQIAVGGLLHDYGKRFISSQTLNFPGRLTKQQFREIQRHPHDGFCQFTHREDLQWGQLMMIYQHHERPDGKGYPVGVTADDIHPWARICKVADVYDALTSDRPYRKADSSAEVLRFMRTKVGTEFDEEVFECFRAMINFRD